jgi:hypothetical protein
LLTLKWIPSSLSSAADGIVINDGAKQRELKRSNRKETRDLTWKPPSTREGKTIGASQQEFHYDRSPVANANGGGLQEVE